MAPQPVFHAPSSRMPSMSFVSTPLGTKTSLLTRNRNGWSPCSQYLYACAAHQRADDAAGHEMHCCKACMAANAVNLQCFAATKPISPTDKRCRDFYSALDGTRASRPL